MLQTVSVTIFKLENNGKFNESGTYKFVEVPRKGESFIWPKEGPENRSIHFLVLDVVHFMIPHDSDSTPGPILYVKQLGDEDVYDSHLKAQL